MDHAKIILEAIRALRRRWYLLALVCGAGMAGTIVYAKTRPPYFETTAKILVESQQISSDLARTTVTLSAPARLQLIEQRLMARDNLIAMIEKLGLFADVPQLKSAAKVTLLRDATQIESISAAGQAWGTSDGLSAFTITVRLGDPEQAAAVANELVDSTITQNLRVRAERARQTLAYFEAEQRHVGGALAEIEAEIADFKKANEDALPESLEVRRASLVRLEESSLDIDRRLLELEEEHADLSASLSGTGTGDTSAAAPEESELRRLELELAQKRRVLGASHPDLRRLERAVAAVTGLITLDPDAEVGARTGPLADRRATTLRLLNQVIEQIDRLHKQKQALLLQREQIDRSVRRTPDVEQLLGALERRHLELQERYGEVAQNRAEARTGEQLEANNQSERFEVVEMALVPDEPLGPNRKKLVVLGSGASVGLALGLVLVLELMNPVLLGGSQLERQVGIRPVVLIPYVKAKGETWRKWSKRAFFSLLIAALALLAVQLTGHLAIPPRWLGE